MNQHSTMSFLANEFNKDSEMTAPPPRHFLSESSSDEESVEEKLAERKKKNAVSRRQELNEYGLDISSDDEENDEKTIGTLPPPSRPVMRTAPAKHISMDDKPILDSSDSSDDSSSSDSSDDEEEDKSESLDPIPPSSLASAASSSQEEGELVDKKMEKPKDGKYADIPHSVPTKNLTKKAVQLKKKVDESDIENVPPVDSKQPPKTKRAAPVRKQKEAAPKAPAALKPRGRRSKYSLPAPTALSVSQTGYDPRNCAMAVPRVVERRMEVRLKRTAADIFTSSASKVARGE